jgi:hypothetical protein
MTGAGMTGVLAKVRSAGKARAYQAPLGCSHRSAPAHHTLNPRIGSYPPSRETASARAPLTMPRTSTTPSLTTRRPRTSRPAVTTPPTLTDRRAGTTRRSTTTRRMTTARPRRPTPRTLRRPRMRRRRPMPGHGLGRCPTPGPIRLGRPIYPGRPGLPIRPGPLTCARRPICPGRPTCPGRQRRRILRLIRASTPRPVLRSLQFIPVLRRASGSCQLRNLQLRNLQLENLQLRNPQPRNRRPGRRAGRGPARQRTA